MRGIHCKALWIRCYINAVHLPLYSQNGTETFGRRRNVAVTLARRYRELGSQRDMTLKLWKGQQRLDRRSAVTTQRNAHSTFTRAHFSAASDKPADLAVTLVQGTCSFWRFSASFGVPRKQMKKVRRRPASKLKVAQLANCSQTQPSALHFSHTHFSDT